MPKVGDHRPSGNDHPHLHLLQVEVNILTNAGGLCQSIAAYVQGHNAELADHARKLAQQLFDLGADKHQDLTKPF